MTQEQIDAVILDFLKAYKAWADKDAPEGSCFDMSHGLCPNLDCYLDDIGAAIGERNNAKVALRQALGGKCYPFSTVKVYWDDAEDGTHHRNPARMAWVNEQIERMEK